ncbi:contactin-6-like isoform X1 [Dysidea avara]|uniref:contactin-6-like isoform X1 n=2 Tax=Dysidea avara TaxID=196820 RepID=UPI003318C4B9
MFRSDKMLSVLLMVCISMVGANISDNIVVHITPVQQVHLDEQVLLECNMTSSDTNKVLSGLSLAWYDGFIPLTPVIKSITNLKHWIVVNISVSSWLQYGRYVCKVESETGTLVVKKTAILPPGIEEEQLIQESGPSDPGEYMVSCPLTSHDITWSLLTINYTELTLEYHNPSFTHDLTSYDKSIKALCFGGGHYSIQYIYPKDYEPVRFIFPAEENSTTIFPSLDPKLIECRTTGSLRPDVTWFHDGMKLESDIQRRLHIVEVSSDHPPYVLQLNIFSPVPFFDSGEYVCMVENKWEVVNRSLHIQFYIRNKDHLIITTYSPFHYLYDGVQFKATCIVQASVSNNGLITMAITYKNHTTDLTPTWTVSTHKKEHGDRVAFDVQTEVKEGSRWFIATVTISDVTQTDSGYYDCIAASFADSKTNTSHVQFFEVPLQIIDYEPEMICVEEKTSVLLTCDIKVEDLLLEYKLFSISFCFYATSETVSILYDADLQQFGNGTVRATLNISQAGYKDEGIYECYVQTLPVDNFLISPTDHFDFYIDARNTTLNVTASAFNNKKKSDGTSSNIIIISTMSVLSAIIFAVMVFLTCYIVKKRCYKDKRVPSYPKKQNQYVNM